MGYAPCTDGSLESGGEKIALDATDAAPAQVARQWAHRRWTSQPGPAEAIEQALELVGPS